MKRLFKWFLMLNKRLYKKATFVVILCIIPIAAFSLSIVAKQESGFITVALAQEDNTDEISNKIIKDFLNDDSLINFVQYDSKDEAYNAVKYGSADIAWLFPSGMSEKINAFSASLSETDSAVIVVEREDSVVHRLTREKLSAALYKYGSRAFYLNFARTVSELDSTTDDEILKTFDDLNITEDLFTFNSDFSGKNSKNVANASYLLAPVRGLLSVLMLLCAMAATLFFMQDKKFGTFSLVPQSKLNFVGLACIMIAVLNVAVVVLLSLWAAGITTVIFKEILQLLLFSLCCAAFCMLLKEIFANIQLYGSVIPLIVVITTALCPVFFDFRKLLFLQLLFPPTYYINSVYNNFYLLYMPLYAAACLGLTLLMQKLTFLKNK